MKVDRQATDEVFLGRLGERLARLRLARNLTQAQLAEQGGLNDPASFVSRINRLLLQA